jgi:NADH-quinone oxidoreductase subunit J
MNLYDIFFYLFAAITLVSAFLSVTTRNILYAAFFLLFTFFGVAGIYVLLGADFLAIVQIMVYVGGILILILFGVMLTQSANKVQVKTKAMQLVPAIIILGVFTGALTSIMIRSEWKSAVVTTTGSSLKSIGTALITDYMVLFELLGILLLVVLIGAATIARKEETN